MRIPKLKKRYFSPVLRCCAKARRKLLGTTFIFGCLSLISFFLRSRGPKQHTLSHEDGSRWKKVFPVPGNTAEEIWTYSAHLDDRTSQVGAVVRILAMSKQDYGDLVLFKERQNQATNFYYFQLSEKLGERKTRNYSFVSSWILKEKGENSLRTLIFKNFKKRTYELIYKLVTCCLEGVGQNLKI